MAGDDREFLDFFGDQGADGIPGGGVDCGELPLRADAVELANIEGVQGDQVTGAGGEVAEPERPILGQRAGPAVVAWATA